MFTPLHSYAGDSKHIAVGVREVVKRTRVWLTPSLSLSASTEPTPVLLKRAVSPLSFITSYNLITSIRVLISQNHDTTTNLAA
jgi:hypothetical protein